MRRAVAPGTELAIDIVGVGPVRGIVRWAQAGKFGVQFDGQFDLARLAPKKEIQPQRRYSALGTPSSRSGARARAPRTAAPAARSLP